MNWRCVVARAFCPHLCDRCLLVAPTADIQKELDARARTTFQNAASKAFTEMYKERTQKLANDEKLSLLREVNVKRSQRRPRTKFKKRWPHGKHSG